MFLLAQIQMDVAALFIYLSDTAGALLTKDFFHDASKNFIPSIARPRIFSVPVRLRRWPRVDDGHDAAPTKLPGKRSSLGTLAVDNRTMRALGYDLDRPFIGHHDFQVSIVALD